jgi:uncharacterized protein (DUF433 family)
MTELTSKEVVALFELDEKRVRKDVEYGVLAAGKGAPRFALAEVVYLYTLDRLPFDLGVGDRKKLYRLIADALGEAKRPKTIELGEHVEVKLASAVEATEDRIERFEKWKQKLVTRADIVGGETVFPNSRIAVRQIGEIATRGASVKEILEDYPSIDEQDVELAKKYVMAYPRVGRPRVRQIAALRAGRSV